MDRAKRAARRKRNAHQSQTSAHWLGWGRRRPRQLSRFRPSAASEEKGFLQGRLRSDREQQPLAPSADRQHEGRSRQARRPARLYRRSRLGRQAGRRRQQHDRARSRFHLPAATRRKAAHPSGHERQEGRDSGVAGRPQRRSLARKARRRLSRLHRLQFHPGRPTRG
jgi:hypothetical protein